MKIHGSRPQPRVAFVGEFPPEVANRLLAVFPTVWQAESLGELGRLVDPRSVDLIVLSNRFHAGHEIFDHRGALNRYLSMPHVICFRSHIALPGPTAASLVLAKEELRTEEYAIAPQPLRVHRRIMADLEQVNSVRGWYAIVSLHQKEDKKLAEALNAKALILDPHTGNPLAASYTITPRGQHVSILPNEAFDQAAWTELLAFQMGADNARGFEGFGNWVSEPRWQTLEELQAHERLLELESRKASVLEEFEREIRSQSDSLLKISSAASLGPRRLLTEQGDELVQAVGEVFEQLGFQVEYMDETMCDAPKREDLRLTRGPWEAIVEVRGYGKSAGKTGDLQRLGRFAVLYSQDKGRLPDKRYYVVNGQIEIDNPGLRETPLAGAEDDVRAFAEDDGVVISTLDLFQAVKRLPTLDQAKIANSICEASGRWTVVN